MKASEIAGTIIILWMTMAPGLFFLYGRKYGINEERERMARFAKKSYLYK